MIKAYCPNCQNDLSVNDNVIITRESEIFKGHNVYVMCKSCGLVMVYNEQRESLFGLDKYQDDEEVIKEIQRLLEEKSLHVVFEKDLEEQKVQEEIIESVATEIKDAEDEVEEDIVSDIMEKIFDEEVIEDEGCHGDCHNCAKSCEQPSFEDFYKVDEKVEEKQPVDLRDVLYMVHKKTDERRFISKDDLDFVDNLDDWMFYEFQRVVVEPVITYNIHKVFNA